MVSVPVRKRIRSIGKDKAPVVGSRDIKIFCYDIDKDSFYQVFDFTKLD